jgi:maltose alpha-D-glucosyltransferase / alpha-amylase
MKPADDSAADPLWFKDAIFYELRVRSFHDGNGDGIGDFAGLSEKLGYLEDLGVSTLWLLPFYPSPLRDDGYDISDYLGVHPDYGTLQDFKRFLRAAHRRGLRVVTELVLNHTSDEHPWFQRARRASAGSAQRDFYVWSESAEKYGQARIIFSDFVRSNWTWDPVAKSHFWHRFYSHQPDLNFDNPAVRRALLRVVDHWLGLGVDGLRLDAVPYLAEREGTDCENLPETHAFLRELRHHVERRYPGRMLLAEANQWPEQAVSYLGDDECHMAFHFPLMPRMFLALRLEDRAPIVDVWAQTPGLPESCQWALFLRNHDELTLEMVTEEERETMYRAYAAESRMRLNLGIRRRLAPLLGNNRRAIELMNGLLLSLPGSPVLYYGDEIGMGDNVYLGDRNGVRTPMQWSADRNAGFSTAASQRLVLPVIVDHEYHYEAVNVETQLRNRHSLLWWMRRLIALRRQHPAFGRGTMELLNPDNPRVLAYLRVLGDERLLVVANLSRHVQLAELDLSRCKGLVPVELFGRTGFPAIGSDPYFFTLGPHGFYWFALEQRAGAKGTVAADEALLPDLGACASARQLFRPEGWTMLSRAVPAYLRRARWFGGKSRSIKTAAVVEAVPIAGQARAALGVLAMARVEYAEGETETYLLPLGLATGARAAEVREHSPGAVVALLRLTARASPSEAVLFDATVDPEFCRALLELFGRRRRLDGAGGGLQAGAVGPRLRFSEDAVRGLLSPRLLGSEQSNSSVAYGERLMLKLFRRLDEGPNPELELGQFLSRQSFRHVPPLAGWLEYRQGSSPPITVALLHQYVPNQGDAWSFTLQELRRFFERALAASPPAQDIPIGAPLSLLEHEPSPAVARMIGAYLETARLLGQRTAELHQALTSDCVDPALAPEPHTPFLHRAMVQSRNNLTTQVWRALRRQLPRLPDELRAQASELLGAYDRILARFDDLLQTTITVPRIRCHGDFHLGQLLYTGKDFVIIDLEGEPARPLANRRRKRFGLTDVAGMLRSFHYAAQTGLGELVSQGGVKGQSLDSMKRCAELWQVWSSWAFLGGYLAPARALGLAPAGAQELRALLGMLLLEKAIYELGYELDHRPSWVGIPLAGILRALEG